MNTGGGGWDGYLKKKFVDKNAIKLKIVYPHPLRFCTNALAPSPQDILAKIWATPRDFQPFASMINRHQHNNNAQQFDMMLKMLSNILDQN